MTDMVNHPPHYIQRPAGTFAECFEYAKYMTFAQGNAFKYVWRAGRKDTGGSDWHKALWYIRAAREPSGVYARAHNCPKLFWGFPVIDPLRSARANVLFHIARGEMRKAEELVVEELMVERLKGIADHG